ncbi:FtsK/SpoIIIE domain-containing protein [Actinoplanes sp. N902-109]|uniref:FtsK/SpoIIIE domain-containing protein n=1 Tax=Actinoplanes sp. (strain N902-109) TaxID=649831 RepID=UPI00032942D5|nr:FtsK/SpoIIIE domain-containing protein [Actinoplanes sp. N902-109]AGL18643.1 cell division protein FtsK/SpoIIIE [Actinoplanes sp. N902-109]
MPESAAKQVVEVRAALSHALGVATDALAAARREHENALTRRTRVVAAARERRARLAHERDKRLHEIDEQHDRNLAELAGAAIETAALAAPGAAGLPWSHWTPTPAGSGAPAPEFRVGRLLLPYEGDVPALVPLLDRGHVAVHGDDRIGDDVVAGLLLRALGSAEPGRVLLTGYDPEQLGGGLAGFAPLAPAGVLQFVGPGGLGALLDELVDHVRRINETVLAGEHSSLRELAAATGRRPEPWRVAILLGAGRPDELSKHERSQLDRLLRTGAACGVHLIVRDLPVPTGAPLIETVTAAPGDAGRLSGCGELSVELDPGPPPAVVTRTCRAIADHVAAGPAPVALDSLLPGQEWQETSARALTAPLGDSPQGAPVHVTLSDYPPHALIAGPSGTGKTNLIYAWMGALAARYSPAELAFYLLDFKEGVSFARFAPGRRDPSWLPHVRLVGVNVNTDREFGLALLRFLGAELRSRADAAKQHEVTNLAELRAEDPEGTWPRIVAVVDEFQVLLSGRDAVAAEAVDLLEDLARRGRSQGIHLVLASQDVSGIEALWGRPALVAQFSLRIALPRARRVLAEQNAAADVLPRYHAVVNADSGALEANRVVRVPDAGDRDRWSELQHRLWRRRPPELPAPRLFDGDAIPRLDDSLDYRRLAPAGTIAAPVVLLGETIDVQARSATTVLRRAPGRNIAVMGTRVDEACAVLHTAARSLAAQFEPGAAQFKVGCFDTDAGTAIDALHGILPADTGYYDTDNADFLFEDATTRATEGTAADRPLFLLLYAVDAAPSAAAGQLRTILRQGPERRVHVIGWWRGASLLRDTLGGPASRTDVIGSWVALDVHGSELSPYYPGQGSPAWYPRPWRALHFDRSVHRGAEVIIPYGPA